MNQKVIYLDYAATTPPAPAVVDHMITGLNTLWGNASSEHVIGSSAHHKIDEALKSIAHFLCVEQSTLTLTSGATESINLALKGVMRAQAKKHMIAITTEHKATLNTAQALVAEGYQVTFLAPNENGQITAEMFEAAITPDTALITTLWVNNETGEIYDIPGISAVARKHKILLHVDATQALPHFKIDLSLVDLASFTAHKIYGPKGIGVLYQRDFPRISMVPVLDGAKTELGNHIGTLANHQILGLARAIELLPNYYTQDIQSNEDRLGFLLEQLKPFGVTRNGKQGALVSAIINIHVPDVYAETLMFSVPHLCFSRGSACNSDETLPSHVLTELGYTTKHARESVRISLGRDLLECDFKQAIYDLSKAIDQLQKISRGQKSDEATLILKAQGNIDLVLLEDDDFEATHAFELNQNDAVIKIKTKVENGKTTKISVQLQSSPYVLWFMNEAITALRGEDLDVWMNFRMNQINEAHPAPSNELRSIMIVEKFIRDIGKAMQS